MPVSDSAGWITGSLAAMKGYKQAWVSRRPLNVIFNAPILLAASQFNGDPLVNSLKIKRILAISAISMVLFALGRIVGLLPVLASGLLLLSVLFSGTGSQFSFILGKAIGYTHGTELNGFIFVTAGVACLLPLFARVYARRDLVLKDVLYAIPGFLLINLSTLMRPGALFLVPLLVIALGAGSVWRNTHIKSSRAILGTKVVAFMLMIALSAGIAGGLQKLAFKLIADECGAIGGNQGYVVYGLSHGANWEFARDYLRSNNIARCERKINPMLIAAGRKKLLSDPSPFFGRIIANARSRALFVIKNKRQLILASISLMSLINSSFRQKAIRILLERRELLSLLALSLVGCLACEIFVLIFLGEGGLRPIIAYAVFPILLFAAVLDLYTRVLHDSLSIKMLLLHGDSPRLSRATSVNQLGYLLLIFPLLSICLAAGLVLISRWPFQLSLNDTGKVYGSLPIVAYSSDSLGKDDWRLKVLDEFYQLKIDAGMSDAGEALCLDYSRDKMPSSKPIGSINVKASGCNKS